MSQTERQKYRGYPYRTTYHNLTAAVFQPHRYAAADFGASIWHNWGMNTAAKSSEPTTSIRLRLRLPFLWLAVLLLGTLFLPDRVWTTLLIGFGGLFLIAYIWVWLLARGLTATRKLRFGWVGVGDRLQEVFTLENLSDLPALWVEISDDSDVPGYKASVVRSLGPRERDQWKVSAICLRRGLFHLGPWEICTGDPFGIFALTRKYPAGQEIIIHPPIHGKLPVPLPQGEASGRARARQRAHQATINAAAVRDYRPNDPINRIHWPTSARHGSLYLREFDLDAAGDIWLLLDLQREVQLGTGEAAGTEETIVLSAASLAARALAATRGVGLAAYGRTPLIIPPATGQGQQWKLLRALAVAEADGDVPLAGALRDLSRVAQRGAAAVIITPRADMAWLPELATLARSGVQGSVALLDRASFGGEGSSTAVRQAILYLGFTADIIFQGDLGDAAHEDERRGFWEFKVTGLGKVIATRRPDEVTGA